MRTWLCVLLVGLLTTACGGDTADDLVAKPDRPNPFPGYARQIRYAKDWHRLSHHLRALTVAHWSHEAGFTKSQSNTVIWCFKEIAESDKAATIAFDDAKKTCFDKAKEKSKP